jgi:hypothetical protein
MALVTISKPRVSDRTIKGFARAFIEDEFCKRNSSYSIYSSYYKAYKLGYSPVSASYYYNSPY